MKALTILQPWADCICYHGKRVENRTWPPPTLLVGERIAIHAGKRFLGEDVVLATRLAHQASSTILLVADPMRLGAVVATAVLAGFITRDRPPSSYENRMGMDSERRSRWFFGPFGWVLRDVKVLEEPVPCRGRQRVWTLPDDIEAAVTAGATH